MKKLKNKNFTSFPALILLNLIFFSCLNIVFTTNFLHDESEDKNFSFEEIVTRKGYLFIIIISISIKFIINLINLFSDILYQVISLLLKTAIY